MCPAGCYADERCLLWRRSRRRCNTAGLHGTSPISNQCKGINIQVSTATSTHRKEVEVVAGDSLSSHTIQTICSVSSTTHREEVEVVVGGGSDLAAPGRQDAAQPHEEHHQHDAGAAQDGALEQRPAVRLEKGRGRAARFECHVTEPADEDSRHTLAAP